MTNNLPYLVIAGIHCLELVRDPSEPQLESNQREYLVPWDDRFELAAVLKSVFHSNVEIEPEGLSVEGKYRYAKILATQYERPLFAVMTSDTPMTNREIQEMVFANPKMNPPCLDFSDHVCFDYECVRIMGVEHHRPECPKYGKPSPEVQELYDKAIAWVEDYVKPEPDPPNPETWRDREPLL